MAICNLTTGVPGSGKTAHAMVNMLKAVDDGRPIYVHGIPNLKINHTVVICDSTVCTVCPDKPIEPPPFDFVEVPFNDPIQKSIYRNQLKNYESSIRLFKSHLLRYEKLLKADQWHIWAPDGAFIFYDEIQFVYPPRSSSSKSPDSVLNFTTHRHKGIDFFLITQSPLLFDKQVRLLVGKHIHLRPTWAGRYQYEYPECNDNVKSTALAVKSKYKLDKKVFSLYKSASLHTDNSRKIPTALYLIIFVFIAFALLGYRINDRLLSSSVPKVENDVSENPNLLTTLEYSELNDPVLDEQQIITVPELVKYSYSSIDPLKIQNLPTPCLVISSDRVRCTVPKSLTNSFHFSFCNKSKCYIEFYIKKDVPKQNFTASRQPVPTQLF